MTRFTFSATDELAALTGVYPDAHVLVNALAVPPTTQLGALPAEIVLTIAKTVHLAPAEIGRTDWTQAGIGELIDHIISHHHRYLFAELGRLGVLIRALSPGPLTHRFAAWSNSLTQHMMHEEDDLFPLCRDLEYLSDDESIAGPEQHLHGMYQGHEEAEADLVHMCEDLSEIHGDPQVITTINQTLGDLISDLHEHIELEDSVLLPAVHFQRELYLSRRFKKSRSLKIQAPQAS